MIDLSFLTEAEQEAILKVLNRDAELKKAEEERVKHLHDVVEDENEYKYKSGQWFYEAKSKRHRDKIHGAELVRASIRKRKKPTTIAELSELNKDSSKRRWVNSVNQDIFIPPELYGVMEAPDEAEEDVKPAKQEGSQSSKKVSFSSPEKTPDNLRNGTLSPPKARQNPFNSEGIQDDIDFKNEAPNPKPEDVQINGTEKPKSDIMPSLAKYGVKLPYPEPPKRTLNSPKSQEEDDFQKQELQVPVPKPRTLRMNGQAQDHSMSPLKRDDSFNGTGKPRGILKRRSSSSSTDSESVRIALSAEPNKIALPGSPIPEAGQNSYFDEEDGSDNSSDRLKQVRFSEKIHQRPPSPSPEPYCSKEFGEYGILDPGLSVDGLDNGFGDHAGSEDIILDQDPTDGLSKVHEPNATPKDQRDFTNKQPLSFAMDQVTPKEDLDLKNDELQLETNTDLSIEPPSNASSDEEPLYAVVKKTPAASSPSQQQEFDLDDALREPRFHGQRGTTPQNIYLNEKPLEFGKSFSGEGKITFEASYPPKTRKESYNEEQTPEKARNTEMSSSNMGDDPAAATQDDNGPVESVALWKRHLVLENQEPRQPSPDLNKVPKTSINILQESSGVGVKVEDTFSKHYPKIQPSPTPGEYSKDTKYKSVFLQNRYDEDKPIGLTTDLPDVPNVSKPSGTGQLDKSLLHENREQDLPKSAHFKVMSLKERMNEMPREQMSNPSRFQSLKHFWNVEEKNLLGGATVTSPDKILMNVSSTSKPNRTDVKQRGSEIPADEVIFPNTLDNLSEEEQTSQKVASWLAQTPPVYVDGQMEQNEEPLYSGEGIEERVQKSTIPKKPDEDFANALQKLREEALEDPKITERSRTEVQMLPERRPDLVDSKQTTIPVFSTSQNSIKVKAPATDFQMPDGGFYQRVIQISNKPPATETLSVETKNKPFEQNLEDTVVPERSPSKFSVNFEKLDNSIPDKKVQKESRLPIEESEEVIERSEVPKSRDQQDFISSLKRLEIEASQPPLSGVDADHQVEVPEEEIRQNAVSPVKSSYKIGFEQFGAPTVEFQPQYVTSIDPRTEEPKAFEETVEKSTVPIRKENEELSIALRKLELEASEPYSDEEFDAGIHQEVELEKPRSPPVVQANLSEDRSDIHLYSRHDGKSVDQQPPKVSSYRLKSNAFEEPGKLPVAEESIERTFVESQEGAADFHKRLRQLEEQAKIPEEPEDLLVDDAVKVSQVPSREVNISKKVYSSIESMPTSTENISEDGKVKDNDSPRTHDSSHYKELAKYPQSPEPSGSYSGTGNMLYKKPEVGSPEVSNSKPDMRESTPMKEKNNSLRKSTLELYLEAPYRREMSKSMDFELGGYVASEVEKDGCMDESHPILSALKRSEAKMLNSKAVQEVSPTSTNQLNSSNPTEDAPVNSFPQNADTLKRLSQSVPAFMQDETDGRDTDSASESSFQIGRHKKSPSSLTNLSGSSGMASMSSVSGSVMSIYSGDFGNVDIKGAIEFSVEYVEQLNEFLIYIYQCKDLAAAEVKKQRSDPYVKAYLLPEKAKMGKRKTAVKKKTLNPVYNEILRYKIAKPSLLAQTLNLSVWHHDALGRNSFLGEVNVNLGTWDWSNSHLRRWYQLEPRTPAAGIGLENRGEMKLSLKYVPVSASGSGTKPNTTGEVYIWIKDCLQLPMLRENKINSFVKCTVLPDTSRKSRQKTRTVDKTPNPIFNHTMVYDGFKEEDLREACVELTVWDHNRLSNHFLGGLRIGLGTGKSYGTAVDWMDSTHEETTMWEKMMSSPNTWVEGMLPLRMFKMAKLTK